jgi:hypothetical protein
MWVALGPAPRVCECLLKGATNGSTLRRPSGSSCWLAALPPHVMNIELYVSQRNVNTVHSKHIHQEATWAPR